MFHPIEDASLSAENDVRNEELLLSQAQAGDEQAFTVLYERYFSQISLYLTRMVGEDDVGCELTQDTFLKVWQKLSRLHRTESFLTWLYRIATNVARDYQRRKKPIYVASEKLLLLTQASQEGPEDHVVAKEQLQLALARVTFKYRACLVLYHVQGYPKQKIAELLDLQESSVGTYLNEQALGACDRALCLDPQRKAVWEIRGRVLIALGWYEKAVDTFERCISLDPNDAEEWRFLGCVFSRLGQDEKARGAYKRAEEIDPNREDVWGQRTASLLPSVR
jgi:RNA polymerase sigma-70 factor, ECF subfamily